MENNNLSKYSPKDYQQPLRSTSLGKIINVAQVPKRSLFRYPGGKTWLVPVIRKWLDGCNSSINTLLEPFAGSGIVSLTAVAENHVQQAILVELDHEVAAVWESVLNGDSEWMCQQIGSFIFNKEAVEREISRPVETDHEIGFRTIIKNRASRSGILAEGAGLIKTGENGKGIASRWYPETLCKRIRAINSLNDRLRFIHGDGVVIMGEHLTSATTAFFIDPPYTTAGKRLYNFSEVDHETIFRLASEHAGPCLLTYDDSPEVRKWIRRYGFRFRRVAMQSAHLSKKKELLISRSFQWLR
ncbi:MAG: DNA adenine methylase [Dissulfurispiraceae bacterium]